MQVGTVSISATELCQIVPSTLPFAILSLLSPLESITYVLSMPAMRSTSTRPRHISC